MHKRLLLSKFHIVTEPTPCVPREDNDQNYMSGAKGKETVSRGRACWTHPAPTRLAERGLSIVTFDSKLQAPSKLVSRPLSAFPSCLPQSAKAQSRQSYTGTPRLAECFPASSLCAQAQKRWMEPSLPRNIRSVIDMRRRRTWKHACSVHIVLYY